jgi:hypothetical protein
VTSSRSNFISVISFLFAIPKIAIVSIILTGRYCHHIAIYRQLTGGLFVQNTARVTDRLSVESGLRGDYAASYGFVLLPRLAMPVKINDKLSPQEHGAGQRPTPQELPSR